MTPIFNSLGSNYSQTVVNKATQAWWHTLIGQISDFDQPQLPSLGKTQTLLTYKGRHAITLALQSLGLMPGDQVGLQAFTCWAVEEAIHAAGLEPVFIDIGKQSLNFDIETLERVRQQQTKLKALIVQHTLGFPADMQAIKDWADRHQILLLEDLAHSCGARVGDQPVGSFAEAVALSFGRDKIIDSITGGAVLSKNTITLPSSPPIDRGQQLRDLLYPFVTKQIRHHYSWGGGKVFHWFLKQSQFLVSPIANSAPQSAVLPVAYWPILEQALAELKAHNSHRRKIAGLFQEQLPSSLLIKRFNLAEATPLRFPLVVDKPNSLVRFLKNKNIHLADRWFREPVETGNLPVMSSYRKGSCPQAEQIADTIMNLPTHRQISPDVARVIIKEIISWYEDHR